MRILLVVKSKKMENLGVMYLQSIIKEADHSCYIVSLDEAMDYIKRWAPHLIGFSIMTGDQERFHGLYEKIRRCIPSGQFQPRVIVGGPHPTFFPKDFPWADFVIEGEAENNRYFLDIIKSTKRYPTLKSIPWPDRSDFPDMPIRDFISSRGCPYNCSYCYNKQWHETVGGQRVRFRDPAEVAAEIFYVRPRFAYFQDSCFGVDMTWLKEFVKDYRKVAWYPYHCHLRPEQVTTERVILLKKSNCVSVRIALETASPGLRKLINRERVRLIDVKNAAELLRGNGISLMIQNMLGLPTATIEDDLSTLAFNIECQPAHAWSSIFVPYPGTVLGDQCKANGWYKGDYSDISDSFFNKSVLEVSEKQKWQTYCLQKIFSLCVETKTMPGLKDLNYKNLPMFVHRAMRNQGDKRLYGGAI